MRIGEIAVVGPPDVDKKTFLTAVCSEVRTASRTLLFGRVPVGDSLVLHVYGIDVQKAPEAYAWDLISRTPLGFVVLYHWYVRESFERAQQILDFLSSQYEVPLVVAADTGSRPAPVRAQFYAGGMRLSRDGKFIFCRTDDPKTMRRVYATLLDTLLDRTPEPYE